MPNVPLTVPLFFLTLIVRLFINNGTKEVGRCENNVTRVFTFGPQLNSHADVFNFGPHLSPLSQKWTQFNYFCINCEFYFSRHTFVLVQTKQHRDLSSLILDRLIIFDILFG